MVRRIVLTVIAIFALVGPATPETLPPLFVADRLGSQLTEYVSAKDANIGIAVLSDDGEIISVNGDEYFPMLSVYKFPQALSVANYCRDNGISLNDTIEIAAAEVRDNTYSPLREKYGIRDLRLPLAELLTNSIQFSDNNACDILFRLIGGPQYTDTFIKKLGFPVIRVKSTEDELHLDSGLCYANSATPVAMVSLLSYFDTTLRSSAPEYEYVAGLMETCSTGNDRLSVPITSDIGVLGHKTGTGDLNEDGRIIAINDVGFVHLSTGRRYYVAVFISDSAHGMEDTSAIIAEISRIIVSNIQ